MAQSRAERLAGPVCCREAARSVASEGQAEAEQAAHGGALAGLSHNDFLCACHVFGETGLAQRGCRCGGGHGRWALRSSTRMSPNNA